MKLTSKELFSLKIVDEIIEEPTGGAHRDREKILENMRFSIEKNLNEFKKLSPEEVINHRKNKFLKIGRGGGFSSQSDESSGLSLKENHMSIIFKKFLNNKKIIIGSIITIIGIITLIYSL